MKVRVLCVDDEPGVLRGMKLHLRRAYAVSTAEDGREALSAAEEEGPFAVVMTDMRMPGMTGIELLKRLARKYPNTVGLLLSGAVDPALGAGESVVFRVLRKPCPPSALREAIEEGVAEHRRRVPELCEESG